MAEVGEGQRAVPEEVGVDQVQVVLQALALPTEQLEAARLRRWLTWKLKEIHRADQTDDPFFDAVGLR